MPNVDGFAGKPTSRRCGSPLLDLSASPGHGKDASFFHGCRGYHERGKSVCTNNVDVPLADADAIVLEALLDDVLDETMITMPSRRRFSC